MKITLLGVRGSIPATGPETKAYGGNTSCVLIEAEDSMLVLDAGSGINNLHFEDNLSYRRIDIVLTHLHIDHIQGLGFFKPIFNQDAEVHLWGPSSHTQSLRSRLGRYFSPPFSPVYFRDFSAKLFVHEIANDEFALGPFKIKSSFILHPGPTLGFRVEHGGKAFVYMPDHEPALGANGFVKDIHWISGSDLALGADLLLHDAQFTATEYLDKKGWGHSAMEDAIAYASILRVKHLLLSHHDPERTDADLDQLYTRLKKSTPADLPFAMAVEGSIIDLS